MAKTTKKTARFTLPARIRSKRGTSGDLSARIALVDRIADLPGIETVERNDETTPRRVEIYLRREASDRALKRKPLQFLCSLHCGGITVSGLSRWEKHQVLANAWGKLVNDQVCVYLPRNRKELDTVWRIVQRAYDRLYCPLISEAGSTVVSTWDWPQFSRTSLH